MARFGVLLAALLVTAAYAEAPDYKQSLIARFPFYNLATGMFAPVYPALAQQLVQDLSLIHI